MVDIYSKVADLPDVLQRVLREVGYHCKDVELVAATTYSVAGSSGDGYRAFTAAVDLREGAYTVIWGSWGGANIFNLRNAVDLDTRTRDLPVDGVVVQGTMGGGHPTIATKSSSDWDSVSTVPTTRSSGPSSRRGW